MIVEGTIGETYRRLRIGKIKSPSHTNFTSTTGQIVKSWNVVWRRNGENSKCFVKRIFEIEDTWNIWKREVTQVCRVLGWPSSSHQHYYYSCGHLIIYSAQMWQKLYFTRVRRLFDDVIIYHAPWERCRFKVWNEVCIMNLWALWWNSRNIEFKINYFHKGLYAEEMVPHRDVWSYKNNRILHIA